MNVYLVYAIHEDGSETVVCAYTNRDDAVTHTQLVSEQSKQLLGIVGFRVGVVNVIGAEWAT